MQNTSSKRRLMLPTSMSWEQFARHNAGERIWEDDREATREITWQSIATHLHLETISETAKEQDEAQSSKTPHSSISKKRDAAQSSRTDYPMISESTRGLAQDQNNVQPSKTLHSPASKKRKLNPASTTSKAKSSKVLQDHDHEILPETIKDWLLCKKSYCKPNCAYIADLCNIKEMQAYWGPEAWEKLHSAVIKDLPTVSRPTFTPRGKSPHSKLKEGLNKVYSRNYVCLYDYPPFQKIMEEQRKNQEVILKIKGVLKDQLNKLAVDTHASYSTDGAPAGDYDDGSYPRGRNYEGRQTKPGGIQDQEEKLEKAFRAIEKLVVRVETSSESELKDREGFAQAAAGIKMLNKGDKAGDAVVEE